MNTVMRVWIPILVFLLLAGRQPLAQTSVDRAEGDDAALIAFVNVAVVSMLDETWLEEQTVIIQGERILSIGPVDTLAVPAGS